jgi:hypothetical protein
MIARIIKMSGRGCCELGNHASCGKRRFEILKRENHKVPLEPIGQQPMDGKKWHEGMEKLQVPLAGCGDPWI